MNIDKKLKRGLADLSRLFPPPVASASQERENVLATAEWLTPLPSAKVSPRLVCSAVFYGSDFFQTVDLLRLVDQLKAGIQDVTLLTVVKDSETPLQRMEQGVRFGYCSANQITRVHRPKTTPNGAHDMGGFRKSVVLFDCALQNWRGQSMDSFFSDWEILGILDHCIFVVPPNTDDLIQAYRLIQFCLTRNPTLNCLILLAGRDAKILWEVIFERFSVIASKFLDCDIGFLGWMERDDMRLNHELMLQEGKSLAQLSAKSQLAEILFGSALSS